ncbi:hypothetical protein [Salininema proteolyticum]|uniref:Superoxide dismutase, Cu-Zn family n=1 Tax=Salininema proteolyticum TaxID=1607685 RepID=A0ABV8TZX6_9ACTN
MRAIATTTIVLLLGAHTSCGPGDDSDPEPLSGDADASAELAGVGEAHGSGVAELVLGDGTEVSLSVAGLDPDTAYISHLHDSGCGHDPPGGEHWLADPAEGMGEDNEIHLSLTTDGDGSAVETVSSPNTADERVKSIVVHIADEGDHDHGGSGDRVLCGDIEFS